MTNTALITGASSGIGRELATIHAEHGGDLIIVARSKDKLQTLKDELEGAYGVSVTVIVSDLSDPKSPQKLYNKVKKSKQQVDILINNAGFGGQGYFHERDRETDRDMIQLNVFALTELTRYFLDDMVERGAGRILQVSSTASFMPGPLQAVYFATKAFVQSFSNAIARELEGTGVTVTNLMPGATETGFEKTAGLDETDLFSQVASARSVAEDGYRAMMASKIDKISGLTRSQKFLMYLLPFIPKKTKLNMIYKIQSKK